MHRKPLPRAAASSAGRGLELVVGGLGALLNAGSQVALVLLFAAVMLGTRRHPLAKRFREASKRVLRHPQCHQPCIADSNRGPGVFRLPPIGGRIDMWREPAQQFTTAARIVDVQQDVRAEIRLGSIAQHRSLNVVKLNSYLTNIEANADEYRQVRASYFPNKSRLPASTLLQVPRLAQPGSMLEAEVVAVLPPRQA